MRLAQDRVALEAVYHSPARSFQQRCLGEYIRPLVESLQRSADDLLGMTKAVYGGGVNPIDTELKRSVNCRN